ncbi:hypothetical protein F5141DRAFT_1065352 [Pisolithus sp. B1]|nr:hypothetical protein F5141DRAFT_1065352 [Pisolithus sp. B1]
MFLPLSAGSLCRTVLVRSGVLCQEGCMTWFSGREKRNSRVESVYQTCGAGPYPWMAWGSGIIGMSLAGASTWEVIGAACGRIEGSGFEKNVSYGYGRPLLLQHAA